MCAPVRLRLHRRRTGNTGREGLRSAGTEACYENAGAQIGGSCGGIRHGCRGSAGAPAPSHSQDGYGFDGARIAPRIDPDTARAEISAPDVAARLGCRPLARARHRLTRAKPLFSARAKWRPAPPARRSVRYANKDRCGRGRNRPPAGCVVTLNSRKSAGCAGTRPRGSPSRLRRRRGMQASRQMPPRAPRQRLPPPATP